MEFEGNEVSPKLLAFVQGPGCPPTLRAAFAREVGPHSSSDARATTKATSVPESWAEFG